MRKPRGLVACEFSGEVRRAFAARGFDMWSCDILPSEDDSDHHVTGDVTPMLQEPWDIIIAHPPCTYLTNAGVRWLYNADRTLNDERWREMREGAEFFRQFLDADARFIAVENPVMHGHGREIVGRRADQCVQPWMFGHGEQKATCFWLKNLPPLMATRIVEGRHQRMFLMSPGPERSKERSRTYPGIAQAMAEQWCPVVMEALA